MNTDITPYNEKGEAHGYWECYWDNGKSMFKGNCSSLIYDDK